MSTRIDHHRIQDIMRDVARADILPWFGKLEPHHISTKRHEFDFVTIADKKAELSLTTILTKEFPGHVVVGEEGVASGIASTDILKDNDKSIFVVDPVDGTANFKNNKREWALMMALVVNGETVAGWIYDVLNDVFMTAEKGGGTTLGDVPVRVAAPKEILETEGFWRKTYFPKDLRPYLSHLDTEAAKFRRVHSLGCSAHEYLRIASGRADFNVNAAMKPWDHLAGALMVEEAGGIVTKWDGSPYTPQDERGGMIVASNPALHAYLGDNVVQPILRQWSDR